MASRYEVEVKLISANNLKNVNWRNGPNRSYAVVWIDPRQKIPTQADKVGDTQPNWDETLVVPLPLSATIQESIFYVDVLHANSESDTKPILIGSAQLQLEDVKNDSGIGQRANRTLKLKRPSGRPQGALDLKITIRETSYRSQLVANDASTYGVPPPAPLPTYGNSFSYGGAPPASNVNNVYTTPTPNVSGVFVVPPPSFAYSAPYGQQGYYYSQSGQQSYGYGQSGQQSYAEAGKSKNNKVGFGTGLIAGALAGGIGAIALEKGFDKLQENIVDHAAEKVEYDQAYSYTETFYD